MKTSVLLIATVLLALSCYAQSNYSFTNVKKTTGAYS